MFLGKGNLHFVDKGRLTPLTRDGLLIARRQQIEAWYSCHTEDLEMQLKTIDCSRPTFIAYRQLSQKQKLNALGPSSSP